MYEDAAAAPFSPVQRQRKFSTVSGTTSLRSVITMRPAGWPPMVISKKTCGIATVFFELRSRRFFCQRVCLRALDLWLVAWVQRLACACAPAEPGLAACLFSPQRGPRGAIFCSAQRDRAAVVVARTLMLALGFSMVINWGWRQ